jgi:hypothetical protein
MSGSQPYGIQTSAPVMSSAIPVQSGATITTSSTYSMPAAPVPTLPITYAPPTVLLAPQTTTPR